MNKCEIKTHVNGEELKEWRHFEEQDDVTLYELYQQATNLKVMISTIQNRKNMRRDLND